MNVRRLHEKFQLPLTLPELHQYIKLIKVLLS